MNSRSFVVPLVLLAAACAPGTGTPDNHTESGPSWHRDVKPIVEARCATCHVNGGIAPFALTSYEETYPFRELIKVAVESRTMPPWMAGPDCNEYQHDRSLTDAQIQTISSWVDAGAPEGNPADPPATTLETFTGLQRVDLTLSMPQAYEPMNEPDDYRCFLVDWPYQERKYVTGFLATPGNRTVVHHVVAFLIKPELVDAAEALDAADALPGYTCFGGPGVGTMGSGAGRPGWLGSWVPGSNGSEFPAGTGIRVEPGSKVVLQIHYNTANGGPQMDQSSMGFRIDDTVEKEAMMLPFANPAWIQQQSMVIPAGQSEVMHSFALDPTGFLSQISGGVLPNGPVRVHSAALHMHTLGTSGYLGVQRADQSNACMLEIPRYDFHWQSTFAFKDSVLVQPGDSLYLECKWDNSANTSDINWGEGTGEEMCLAIFYVSEP